jgi:DNA polymerase III gamma/tau subunit
MLDKLITNAEIYENAITEMANYMTEIFGQCAESMADSFITAFKESGEAALDYGDIMDDVATNIAKSIIKHQILKDIFSEEDAKQAAEKLLSGDAAGAMEIVESAMERAKELTPGIQALLESLKPYMQMEETAGQSLGDGIKGITEDTANLLASYLNAIRADVSYSKVLWQNMDSNLQALAASLANFSAPSLMEYQQQIAANTLNTANHTRDILDTLTGLLVSGNEGSAIRVYM